MSGTLQLDQLSRIPGRAERHVDEHALVEGDSAVLAAVGDEEG